MKQKRCTEEQIAFALRQHEAGTSVQDIVRKLGIAEQTFYRWKKKYGDFGSLAVIFERLQIPNREVSCRKAVGPSTLPAYASQSREAADYGFSMTPWFDNTSVHCYA